MSSSAGVTGAAFTATPAERQPGAAGPAARSRTSRTPARASRSCHRATRSTSTRRDDRDAGENGSAEAHRRASRRRQRPRSPRAVNLTSVRGVGQLRAGLSFRFLTDEDPGDRVQRRLHRRARHGRLGRSSRPPGRLPSTIAAAAQLRVRRPTDDVINVNSPGSAGPTPEARDGHRPGQRHGAPHRGDPGQRPERIRLYLSVFDYRQTTSSTRRCSWTTFTSRTGRAGGLHEPSVVARRHDGRRPCGSPRRSTTAPPTTPTPVHLRHGRQRARRRLRGRGVALRSGATVLQNLTAERAGSGVVGAGGHAGAGDYTLVASQSDDASNVGTSARRSRFTVNAPPPPPDDDTDTATAAGRAAAAGAGQVGGGRQGQRHDPDPAQERQVPARSAPTSRSRSGAPSTPPRAACG